MIRDKIVKRDSFEGQKMLVLHRKAIQRLCDNDFTNDLYVTDIGYFPNAQYHFRERKQGCLEYILIFCVKGTGWVEVNGERSYLRKNQYFIIPRLEAHRYAADDVDPWTIYWIHFAGEKTRHFVFPQNYPRELSKAISSREGENLSIQLFEDIYIVLEAGLFNSNLEYSSVLLTNLLGSLKYLSLFRKTKELQEKDPVSMAIIYMKANLKKKLTVQELAAKCDLSVSHFCMVFKQETNHSPIEHFIILKMQRACNLLDFTSMKIKQVANEIGYDDAYYFTRVFTKVMGKSPSIYRQSEA